MNTDVYVAILALLFFAASVIFWIYAWAFNDRPESLVALWYAAVFGYAGVATLVLWRVTSG